MLDHWTPLSVLILCSFLLPMLTPGIVAIISAWRGNAAAAQQAMLLQHDQQIHDLAKQIMPPGMPQPQPQGPKP